MYDGLPQSLWIFTVYLTLYLENFHGSKSNVAHLIVCQNSTT